MNFSSRIAKIGRGKFVNGYKNESGEICLYLNNRGMVKKKLTDDESGYNLFPEEYENTCSEIIKLNDGLFVERVQKYIKVKSDDK